MSDFGRWTERARRVASLSLREALALGHNYVGTEHILLALLREEEGLAARVLANLGVNEEVVRRETFRLLSGPRVSQTDTDLDYPLQLEVALLKARVQALERADGSRAS